MDKQTKNKIMVAEFDGWTEDPTLEEVYTKGDMIISNPSHYPSFNYDTNWNWLMPVVKKITDTHFNSKNIDYMKDYGRHLFLVQDKLCEADIKKTYAEIVKWIKWYNKKEKQQ